MTAGLDPRAGRDPGHHLMSLYLSDRMNQSENVEAPVTLGAIDTQGLPPHHTSQLHPNPQYHQVMVAEIARAQSEKKPTRQITERRLAELFVSFLYDNEVGTHGSAPESRAATAA